VDDIFYHKSIGAKEERNCSINGRRGRGRGEERDKHSLVYQVSYM